MVAVHAHPIAGLEHLRTDQGVDHTRQAVFAGHHRAVRHRASDVGDQSGDDREVRRPAHVGDRCHQDLTALDGAGLVDRLRHAHRAFDDAPAGRPADDLAVCGSARPPQDPRRGPAHRYVLELQRILIRQCLPPLQCALDEVGEVVGVDDASQLGAVEEEDQVRVGKPPRTGEQLAEVAVAALECVRHQRHLGFRVLATTRAALCQPGKQPDGRRCGGKRLAGYRTTVGGVERGLEHGLHHRPQAVRVVGPGGIAHTQFAVAAVTVAVQEPAERGAAGTVCGAKRCDGDLRCRGEKDPGDRVVCGHRAYHCVEFLEHDRTFDVGGAGHDAHRVGPAVLLAAPVLDRLCDQAAFEDVGRDRGA